ELKLSHMIRDLLHPRHAHGQGSRFLECFLDLVIRRSDFRFDGTVRCRCEALTRGAKNPERRIDILVSLDGRFGIGIENKPWENSKDQPGWVEDYSQHL